MYKRQAVNYTLNLLKKKDEQLMAKDARIEALMDRLMDKCPNCEDVYKRQDGACAPLASAQRGIKPGVEYFHGGYLVDDEIGRAHV